MIMTAYSLILQCTSENKTHTFTSCNVFCTRLEQSFISVTAVSKTHTADNTYNSTNWKDVIYSNKIVHNIFVTLRAFKFKNKCYNKCRLIFYTAYYGASAYKQ